MIKTGMFVVVFFLSGMTHAETFGDNRGHAGTFSFGWAGLRDDHTTSYANATSTDSQFLHLITKGGYQWTNGLYVGFAYEYSAWFYNAVNTPNPETRIINQFINIPTLSSVF